MAIKSYNNKADYDAAVKSTIESQVSMIETTREIIVDGVNVATTDPTVGDVVFLGENSKPVFVKGGDWIQKANIPAGWTHIGYVFMRQGRKVGVINKTGTDEKYLDVCQYSITVISSTTLSIKLRMSPDYASDVTVDVTLTSTDINATSADEISTAVAAKATERGDTKAWWAYLADANGNKVTDNGTQIIIQCDECVDYRFYICSATGCTITHSTWGDMPASTTYFKINGKYSEYRGLMNFARGLAYWTNSGRVPSANVVLPEAGNTDPLKKDAFDNSEYCADVRAKYATYDEYLYNEFMVKYPQKLGTFALPEDKELSMKYAPMTAPTKAGGTKAKFPALNKCYLVDYGADGLKKGDWYLPGSLKGCYLMNDDTLSILAPSISKMGTTAINNSAHRWFAERYSAINARNFNGSIGSLGNNNVNGRYRTQAVTLLEI